MAILANTLEGGTDGATVTSGNSGGASGNAFTAANALLYTNTRAMHGSMSMFRSNPTTTLYIVRWAVTGNAVALRFYYWMTAAPTASLQIALVGDATNTDLNVLSSGLFQLKTGSGTVTWTSSSSFPSGQWVRVELYVTAGTSTTTGTARAAYFLGDAATATEDSGTITGVNTAAAAAAFTNVRVGKNSGGSYTGDFYVDSLKVHTGSDAVGFIGGESRTGTGTGTWSYSGSAFGKLIPAATATGTLTYTGAASGIADRDGTAVGTVAYTGTAAGKRITAATSTGSFAYAGAATGKRQPEAAGAGTITWSGVATGGQGKAGAATGTVAWTGAAAGIAARAGTATGAAAYIGAATGTASAPPMIQIDARSGTFTGTSATVTLPTYQAGDYLILWVSSNGANAQTLGGSVTGTVLANASNRLIAWRVQPTGTPTTCTINIGASAVLTWWVVTYRGVDPSLTTGTGLNLGNSTTSAIEPVLVSVPYISNGSQLVLHAGSVNATATWTSTADTLHATTAGNAALMVTGRALPVDALTGVPAVLDRGLNATSRNESTATVVIAAANNPPVHNLLGNPSFEDAAAVSAGWETEASTAVAPAWTKSASGVVDGARSQQVQYAGVAGDTGPRMFALYQSPIPVSVGQLVTFGVYLSGTKTACSLIVGVEGFAAGQVYISEVDTAVLTLTGTPTLYEVAYLVPVGAVAVAVYIQANEITPSSTITMRADKAVLVTEDASSAVGSFTFNGAAAGKRTTHAVNFQSDVTWTSIATGKRVPVGATTGTLAFTGEALGKQDPIATTTGDTAWQGEALGDAPYLGATTFTITAATITMPTLSATITTMPTLSATITSPMLEASIQ